MRPIWGNIDDTTVPLPHQNGNEHFPVLYWHYSITIHLTNFAVDVAKWSRGISYIQISVLDAHAISWAMAIVLMRILYYTDCFETFSVFSNSATLNFTTFWPRSHASFSCSKNGKLTSETTLIYKLLFQISSESLQYSAQSPSYITQKFIHNLFEIFWEFFAIFFNNSQILFQNIHKKFLLEKFPNFHYIFSQFFIHKQSDR